MKPLLSLLLLAILLCTKNGMAQSPKDTLYLVASVYPADTLLPPSGVYRYLDFDPNRDAYPSPVYTLFNTAAKFELYLFHNHFRPDTLSSLRPYVPESDAMRLQKVSASFLNRQPLFDADAFLSTLNAPQAWAFGRYLADCRLFVIDRAELERDSVSVVEAACLFTSEPQQAFLLSPNDSVNYTANLLHFEAMATDSTYREMIQKSYPEKPSRFYDCAIYAETMGWPAFERLPQREKRAIRRDLSFFGIKP